MTHYRFSTAVAVEAYKLRRSLALVLVATAPLLIAVFVCFNLLRLGKPAPWDMTLRSSVAIWAYFMLPMCVTALAALMAHTEHGPRSWDHLRALPRPRWHLYAAKAVCMLGLVAIMSVLLALFTIAGARIAQWLDPDIVLNGDPSFAEHFLLLGRVFLAAWLLVAVQLWIALRFASFVPALATGIAGTFFAVVATSADIGMVLPWQIPVNQLATDPARAHLTLLFGIIGGSIAFALMLWRMSVRETTA